MATLHEQLLSLLDLASRKLAALRNADVAALSQLATEEAAQLESLARADADRPAIIARLAQQLPGPRIAPLKLSALSEKLPEPFSSQIRAKSEGLRAIATRLEEKNRLAAIVARTLHKHIRGVFADLAKANQETVVYGRTGQHEQRTTRSWVDAVG
ncbi:MAG: flagellar export chaperone FlgN [Planctomycetes bacterium]|nr:flagellar export chaperone FlgN [Planctomycetota bacterium]